MTKKQEIDNEIHRLRERVQVLELERAKLPIGYMTKLRQFLKKRLAETSPERKFDVEVIDSFNDQTCGVLFGFYEGRDKGHTITRTPRLELIKKYVFNGPEYTIIASYATPNGLVLEVREN